MVQWSPMLVTICLYILFILVVLSISFPLKSHDKHTSKHLKSEHEHEIGSMANDVDFDGVSEDSDDNDVDDDNQMGDDEHRLLQRARNLPSFSNRSVILRDAFQR